jgi:hypothetical protein
MSASILAFFMAASMFAAGSDCDRACLKTTLDQYLNAVIKHDPNAAPLMIGFRQTENAVVVKLGTGVWKSATAFGKMQRRYFDTVSGQAAYFGLLVENGESGAPSVATLRLKVENRKVTEAEWIIARKGDPGLSGTTQPGQFGPANVWNPDNLIATAPPERVVPKEARLSREAMIGITNSYFDGLTTHDGTIIQAHSGCVRIENGTTMTGRGARGGPPTDCTSGLETINIQLVAGRRFPIVDEEAGVVLAMATFIRKPGTNTRRNMFSEWFFIDNNKIRTIYAAMFYPPPEAPVPNWPPYEGNWPLP